MSKALEAAVKAAHDLQLKEPGPTFHDVSVGKDGIRAIITAFLDAAAGDEEPVARAILETWRKSEIAPEDMADFTWEELCDLAFKYPHNTPGKMKAVALAEAKAAILALKEAVNG